MTLRCRRCNRAIKAQTMLAGMLLVSYGPVCARIQFGKPPRRARTCKLVNHGRPARRRIGANQSQLAQLELELEVA